MNTKKRQRVQWSPLLIVVFSLLILYTLTLIIPMIWALISSLKTDSDFRNNLFGLPSLLEGWQWKNYPMTFFNFYVEVEENNGYRNVYMPEQFLNSILYSTGCAFFATFVPCMVGYLTAKFNYKFSRILTTVVIICITLPIVGSLPSEIQVAKQLGLYDNIWGMWIMKANFLSMYLLIFQGMFRTVPNDYIEAAKIDGASNFAIFFRIMFPIVSGMFLTVFILNFIGFWNDYQTPLIFMPNKPTVAYGLFLFNKRTEGLLSPIPFKLAGSMLVMLPIMIIFIVFQKRLMEISMDGGLKR